MVKFWWIMNKGLGMALKIQFESCDDFRSCLIKHTNWYLTHDPAFLLLYLFGLTSPGCPCVDAGGV